jgi:osmoprotectant transport system permease protein
MTWFLSNWPTVLLLTAQHLAMSVPAVVVSTFISIPIGYVAHKYPRGGGFLLVMATLLYAIPSLPLLIVIPLFLGIPLRSPLTMITALSLYGVALLAQTATDAFNSVDQKIRDAAIAIGNSPQSVFWHIDLPLATPVLISGIRVVTVSTIGLTTIGALVGTQSLGTLLTDGFQRGIIAEVTTGVIATMVLALLLDQLLLLLERFLTPWTPHGKRWHHTPERGLIA